VLNVDWPRVSRWGLLATFVMACWLLAPVAKCSYAAFRDTPLDTDTDEPSRADADRIARGKGFFDTLGSATKVCYARTPLLDQSWKSDLLLGAAAVTILGWGLGMLQRRR
jgi:hypothetical protein